jgi:hypothetical protein
VPPDARKTRGPQGDGASPRDPLPVRRRDLLRATLPEDCGNVGFLGFAPDGSSYHVVVPVDAHIARGLKAGERPADGTPFGGYRGWHYFRCAPFPPGEAAARARRAERSAADLGAWATRRGLLLELTE